MADTINATVAKVMGGILLLMGILGFFPALLVNEALFGIFGVNVLLNLVHLVSGIALLALGFAAVGVARVGNQVFGVIYLIVAVLGFIATDFTNALLNLNGNGEVLPLWDNLLHTLLAVVFLGVGFGVRAHGPATARGI